MATTRRGAVTDVDAWRRRLANSLGRFEIARRGRGFVGRVSATPLGRVAFVSMWSNGHTATRAAGTEPPEYVFTFRAHGSASLSQSGRTALVKAGSFSLYDINRPVQIESSGEYSSLCLRIPQRELTIPTSSLQELTAVAMNADAGVAPALAGVLGGLEQMRPGAAPGTLGHLGSHVVGLVETMLREQLGALGLAAERGERELLRRRIDEYIERNLGRRELSVDEIATAHFVSGRTLHKIFAEDGRSVWSWILRRRIERAQHDLADPLQAATPSAVIGQRWGFDDPSYFARCFRSHTGFTPGRWRAQALRSS